jgi:hypothetical protein
MSPECANSTSSPEWLGPDAMAELKPEYRRWDGEGPLRDAARRRDIGVYINGATLNRGGPGIVLTHRGMTLAEFGDCISALR